MHGKWPAASAVVDNSSLNQWLWRELTFFKPVARNAGSARLVSRTMMNRPSTFLPDIASASDERLAALSYVREAFAEAVRDGIEADCFAQAALFTGLQELVATYGEEAVATYAEKFAERIRSGEFTIAVKH